MNNTNNTNGTKNINRCIKIAIFLVLVLFAFSSFAVYSCKEIKCKRSYNTTKVDSAEICNKYTQPDTIVPVTEDCYKVSYKQGTIEKYKNNTQNNEVNDIIDLLSFWISLWLGITSGIITLLTVLFTYNQHKNNKELKEETEKLENKTREEKQNLKTEIEELKEDFKKEKEELIKKLKKEINDELEKSIKKYNSSSVYNRISATTSFLCQTLDNPTSLPEDKKPELQKTLFKTIHKDYCNYLRYISIYITNVLDYDEEENYIYLVLNNIGSTINRTRFNLSKQDNLIYFDRCVNEISKTIQRIINRKSNRESIIEDMTYIRDCLDCFIKKL